eukprot:1414265-Pleurochrysis_carterae.AAC.1
MNAPRQIVLVPCALSACARAPHALIMRVARSHRALVGRATADDPPPQRPSRPGPYLGSRNPHAAEARGWLPLCLTCEARKRE